MNSNIKIAAFGLLATLMTIAVVSTIQSASAINDKFTRDCTGPGESGGEGPCKGQSERSGPHDETLTNPSGKNQPPGLQEDDD
jgi:hypothetical protein